jgi:hypothetical protein
MCLRIGVKKKISSRYGKIEIANSAPFSSHPNGFGISPYLQEKLVYLAQLETYQQAAEVADTLLGISIHSSQLYRLATYYGQVIESDLDQARADEPVLTGLVYAQADGCMVLTEEGYKETKLARIFKASDLQESVVEDRGGCIGASLYTAHLGSAADFGAKIQPHLDGYQGLDSDLVFITDGALWLRQLIQKGYPQATLILDLYHVMSYIGQAALAEFGEGKNAEKWIQEQRTYLLNSQLDTVLTHIRSLAIPINLRESICQYLESNRDRMDYAAYRRRGLLIGSGAIESAHRTVVQKRLKRAGQRWTIPGAQCVLNLRVAWMSKRWELVRNQIEPYQEKMAA